MARISPDPHLLQSLSHQDLPWWKALAELVDNSFDAGAARVSIKFDRGILSVRDDGRGVKDLLALATLGNHKPHNKSGLGMHGVGCKDAWLSCSDVMEVASAHKNQLGKFRVDVRELMANDWECEDPQYSETDLDSFTEFRFALRPGKRAANAQAFDDLAFAFTPALQSGKQIVVASANRKSTHLEPHLMPPMCESIQAEFEIDGKSVSIDVGILADGHKLERGPFWIIYQHRIIGRTSIGIGQYSKSRIGGIIRLGTGWKLSKNKEAISENTEKLQDEIFERIQPLLEKAQSISETIESAQLRAELEGMLNSAASEAMKKREKRDQTRKSVGTVLPKGTPRRRRRASKVSDLPGMIEGSQSRNGRRRGFILDWCDSSDTAVMGEFDRLGLRVSLNLNHKCVAAAKQSGNRMSLLLCAAALIADHECRHDCENKLLSFQYGDFASVFGALSASFHQEAASDE